MGIERKYTKSVDRCTQQIGLSRSFAKSSRKTDDTFLNQSLHYFLFNITTVFESRYCF